MAVKSRAVSVATTATRLDTADETDRDTGSSLVIYNNGAETVYIGGSAVTTAAGLPVAAGTFSPAVALTGNISGATDDHEAIYGIVATGTVEVRVLEAGV